MAKQKNSYTIKKYWREDGYDWTMLYGLKSYMKGYQYARAIFGDFEVQGRYIIHSTYCGEEDGWISTESETHSEMLDDINHLKNGLASFS